jgi:hypothetical protein
MSNDTKELEKIILELLKRLGQEPNHRKTILQLLEGFEDDDKKNTNNTN